ncbi:Plant transposase [Abeliophyllum distichum]|uniref:Plant transposase n=1 Tax=Abeliophyllum distichum TaxID=126358 RepID=A0ABD1SB15_9LAMI
MEEVGKPTDTLSVYIEMRTDLGGNPKDDYAAALIHEFNKKLNDLPMEEQNLVEKRDKILMDVLGDEGHGRVRTRGSGPTPSEIYGKKVTYLELDSSYKERLRSEIVQDLSKEFEDKFN